MSQEENKNIKGRPAAGQRPSGIIKVPYETPDFDSEELVAFGAACNGSTAGSRKESTGAPNFCLANRLLS